MKLTKPKITEAQVQKSILEFLTLKKIVHFRLNSGAVRTQSGGYCRLQKTGTPDILALPQRWNAEMWGATPVFIEVKRPGIGKLTDAQKAMHAELKDGGFIVITADDVQTVIDLIAKLKV
jgi:hypothetical protein